MSLGAPDRVLDFLGNIYWYTIEFGLLKEGGRPKFYGAGIASSADEIKNF